MRHTAVHFTIQEATNYWLGGILILAGITVIWFFTRKK